MPLKKTKSKMLCINFSSNLRVHRLVTRETNGRPESNDLAPQIVVVETPIKGKCMCVCFHSCKLP